MKIQAVAPLVGSIPAKFGEHDFIDSVMTTNERGDAVVAQQAFKRIALAPPHQRYATPLDIEQEQARIASGEASRISTVQGKPWISFEGDPPMELPDDIAQGLIDRGLAVRVHEVATPAAVARPKRRVGAAG